MWSPFHMSWSSCMERGARMSTWYTSAVQTLNWYRENVITNSRRPNRKVRVRSYGSHPRQRAEAGRSCLRNGLSLWGHPGWRRHWMYINVVHFSTNSGSWFRGFNAIKTKTHHLSSFSAGCIHLPTSQPVSLPSVLILTFHVHCLLTDSFPRTFPTDNLYFML